jgi:hypothetical protein
MTKEAWEHRGVPFSIEDKGDGKWGWKLHPYLVVPKMRSIISGEASGTLQDAIATAEAAIDGELGKPNPFNSEKL